MENNKTDKFTFYQPYWDLVKDEDGATVKSIIGHICRYMLDGNEEKPTNQTQALIWEDLVKVLAPQREKELQGKASKAYNARWKHFSFRRNYYNKLLSLENDQAKEYLQAICELAFNGRQPKELSATVKKYYELTLLTLNTSIKRKKAGSKGGTAPRTKQETPTTLHTVEDLKEFGCTGSLSLQNPILDGVDVNELFEFVKANEETHSMSLYIYTVVFDTETLKFDLVYKSEITMPVYYTIKNCSIYSEATSWVEMSVNPANADEFVINNFNVTAGKSISFYNNLHTSNYKVTLEDSANNKLASAIKTIVTVNVGGNYNIYINRKTYVVRMELINPDTATYGCVYYDSTEFITLQPYETDVPYIFHYQITVDKYDNLPDFHSANYRTYDLVVVDTTNVLMGSGSNHYFKNTGTYNLIINLKTFEITVELLPE